MRPDSDPPRQDKSRYGKRRERRARPLDPTRLEELALAYVARFATSARKRTGDGEPYYASANHDNFYSVSHF